MTADESGARGAQDARGLGALTHQSERKFADERVQVYVVISSVGAFVMTAPSKRYRDA